MLDQAVPKPSIEATVEQPLGGTTRDLDATRVGEDTEPMAREFDVPRLPRGTSVSRYVVIDELGAGGMGVVYAAYDPKLDRRIAIKLLRPSHLGEGRPRLMREAQAIARISHPNVVAVHDVGEHEGAVFVAMEFVEGQTLGRWLRACARTIPEILDVFEQAGRGLAAAHEAELVHRDFKPDNVLVGSDGRVRVVDFGLARGRGSAESIGPSDSVSRGSLDEALTEVGTVMGTPAYMSPEQLAGRMATASSDQFAFCVALYEALYGERPFRGTDVQSLSKAVYTGAVEEPPAGRSVPMWLRREILRGLRVAPRNRHPSMEALLHALRADPSLRRRRWLAAGAVGLGTVTVLGLAYASGSWPSRSPCEASAQEIMAVWSDEQRAAVAAAFRATSLPHAEDTWARVAQQLDAYADRWSTQATEACEAALVKQTQSTDLFERRRRCLGERLQRLDGFLGVLVEADATVVDHAIQGIAGLPDLEGCSDTDALLSGVAPPEQESTRQEVGRLRTELAHAEALSSAGRYRELIERLEPLVEQARALGYPPLQAELEHALARAKRSIDDAEGIPLLRTAFHDALAAGDDRRAAMIAIDMGRELGYEQQLYERGTEWLDLSESLLQRQSTDPRIEIAITNTRAMIAIRQAHYDRAQALFERSVELQREHDPDSPNLAVALLNLGSSYAERRDFEHAREYLQQSAELTERVLGPKHPSMTSLYANLALLSMLQGRFEEAEGELQRALDLQRAVLGDEHLDTVRSIASMAVVQRNLGRPEAAERLHREALEIRRRKLGSDHPEVAESMRNLALALVDLDRLEEALELAEQGQKAVEGRLPPEHPEHGHHAVTVAKLLLELGRAREALAQAERAVKILDASGRGPTVALEARRFEGRALRELGRVEPSLRMLEEVVELEQAHDRSAELALARFELAQSLTAAGREPQRAMELASLARQTLREHPAHARRELQRVEAWLASRQSPAESSTVDAPRARGVPSPLDPTSTHP
ncbi:serine/threonine-protein kinase [Paraliomyxa miuraensis]|uniref:serine/threonine-protein kinase n=1 Tax=Paraliomyxa miuraensis TaxID=376150 RepID=UPI00224FBF2E|nr:serine/threonine-protein kinase [Paraliomyxa miuraensis]MCX4243897.1 serine/threonine-protein kinase [Paraliomyxa miuraensis]